MKKIIQVAAMFIIALGFTSITEARENPNTDRITRGVEAAGVPVVRTDLAPAVTGERLRLHSTLLTPEVVANFQDRFDRGIIVDGLKVVGMAKLVRTNSWTFTLVDEEDNMTSIVVQDGPEGSSMTLGRTHKTFLAK